MGSMLRLGKQWSRSHRFVELLNRLVDISGALVVVLVVETGAPVAEVGADDEQVVLVGQIFAQQFAVKRLFLRVERPDQNGHNRELVSVHHFGHERQMHFNAVLVFVSV